MTTTKGCKTIHTALIAGVMVLSGNAHGTDLDLANGPLFVAAGADPNIIFLIDNSGSMSNIVPDLPYDPTDVTYGICPAAVAMNPGSGQVDIRVTSGGSPYFNQSGTNYEWGNDDDGDDDDDDDSRKERCFDPAQDYMVRLYANSGGSGSTKSPSGYLRAQYTGHYLNWYFASSPTSWGTDARNKPGTERRIDIAKQAASTLVSTLNGARVGLASYNGSSGAKINVGVDDLDSAQRSSLTTAINALSPSGSTPLAESLHEIGRYFVGQSNPQYDGNLTLHPSDPTPTILDDDTVFNRSPSYATGVSSASPIEYFCQQNFAVLLTDGRPQSDQDITSSTNLQDYDDDCPNGNDGVTCNANDRKVGQVYESAGSDYLDDVAMALNEIDLRPDLDDLTGNEVTNNIVTYTIGFADDQVINDPLMQDTADNGGGLFLQAANAGQLASAFAAATVDIFAQVESSASSLSFNMGSVRAGAQVYQARFYNRDWKGELLALALHDGSGNNGCSGSDPIGKVCPNPVWDASCTLTGGVCDSTGATIASPNLGTSRQILTYKPTTSAGVALSWANLDTAQKNALRGADNEATGMARLGFLRGDRACEQGSTGTCSYTDGTNTFNTKSFRTRANLLGDIVHGSPLHVGVPQRRYPVTWDDLLRVGSEPEDSLGSQTYADFKTLYANRMTMVYTAANDGLVHGFESGKYNSSGTLLSGNEGKELLAYMPSQALENARLLADPNYAHRYYVDGAPVENDVYFQGDKKWHTILVGGLGLGGHGLYALNVTNPDLTGKPDPKFEETNANNLVLWEFTDADDGDLGYTVGKPAIVRLHNGKWGVLVSNGYNSSEADGNQSPDDDSDSVPDSPAVLFVLDAETGAVIKKLDTGVGAANDPLGLDRPNGLAAVFPVDKDGDFVTDYAYAGDLFGNVWRFDLIDSSASNWHVADFDGDTTVTGTPTPLFTAVDASGNPQSITTEVQVNKHPNGLSHGVMVFFGTGKYLENGDSSPDTTTTQTFYSIWDKSFFGVGSSINVLGSLSTEKKHGFARNELQQQQINAEESASGNTFRRVTDNSVTWASGGSGSHGWYLDLKVAGGSNEGEMMIADPVVRGDAVVFTTLIPSQNPCVAGGSGFLMVLDQATGGRLKQTAFDVNNDNKFNSSDYLSFGDGGKEAASGIDITGGTPGFILAKGKDLAVIPRFDGSVDEEELNLGIPVKGRKTWRQLR